METKKYFVGAAHNKEWMYSDRSEDCSYQPTLEAARIMARYYLTEEYRINSETEGRSFDSPGRNLGYSFIIVDNNVIEEYTASISGMPHEVK